jgi:predicted AAA+ superfamily ATPase
MPALRVIAAGSLLETMLDVHVSFPVGRVEFMLLHPASFEEWLGAREETSALQAYREVPVPDYAHDKLEALFRLYLLTGGMPEAVRVFAETGDLAALDRIHESLIIAYLEDVEKYGIRKRKIPVIRHVIQSALTEASGRIRYEGFGNSNYAGRDVKEAFDALQKAFLFQVIHPVTTTFLPLAPNGRKSPRLHALDTGLVVFKAGMRKELFAAADVSAVFAGRIIEHAVGQELYATSDSPLHALHFWARDKHQSSAEVDYVLPSEGRLIPIEVKAGATGRLRSLHAFMDEVSHATAVRLYGGRFRVEKTRTLRGKEYTLLNIPWYQSAKTVKYLERLAPAG